MTHAKGNVAVKEHQRSEVNCTLAPEPQVRPEPTIPLIWCLRALKIKTLRWPLLSQAEGNPTELIFIPLRRREMLQGLAYFYS